MALAGFPVEGWGEIPAVLIDLGIQTLEKD
jgi:hypothetical protein